MPKILYMGNPLNSENKELSIVLPAFNEEENIGLQVDEIFDFLKELEKKTEIIVVNDGSKDGTARIMQACLGKYQNLKVITHERNLGYGAALRTGFAEAQGDLIFFMDSDLQFNIREIAGFLEKIKEYDFLVGYRKNRKDPSRRIFYAAIFRIAARIFFGVKVKDVDCAFKLFKKEILKNLPLSEKGALINLEIFALSKKKGYGFSEIPVSHFPRKAGKPTGGNLKVIFKAIANIYRLWRKIRKI